LTSSVDITAHYFSKSAVEAIEAKGGKTTAL
jgi:ribosomal protein L15